MAIKFNKITRNNQRNVAVGQKLEEHGICFERLANGDARFSVNIMVDGQRIHRIIGKESDGTTRLQAEEFIQKVKHDAKMGRLNLPKGRKCALNFEQAADKYLEKLEKEGGKNIQRKKQQINFYLKPNFSDKLLNKITTSDVECYKKMRLEKDTKPSSINRELATLSHLFTKAMEWKWLDAKPAIIKRLKESQGRITYLTVEQVFNLLAAAKKDSNPHIYPFIFIGLETAMRRMEILSIKLADIDLNHCMIHIPQAKAGAREQPITDNLANFLKDYLKDNVLPDQIWLFPTDQSKTGHVMNIEKPFRRVVAAAGLDPSEVVRHTLRHTAITHLVQAGVDLPTVKRISGHKTLQMVERYSHQNGEHIRVAMNKLEQRYQIGITKKPNSDAPSEQNQQAVSVILPARLHQNYTTSENRTKVE